MSVSGCYFHPFRKIRPDFFPDAVFSDVPAVWSGYADALRRPAFPGVFREGVRAAAGRVLFWSSSIPGGWGRVLAFFVGEREVWAGREFAG